MLDSIRNALGGVRSGLGPRDADSPHTQPGVSQQRVPRGVPKGGQFQSSARAEAETVLDAPVLPDWEPPVGTSTPEGAFSRCKETSAAYTEFLRSHGVDATWVQVVGPRGDMPDADARWLTLGQSSWQHYVTRVGDYDIDWTARQFDPAAEYPHVTVHGDGWDAEYPLPDGVAAKFLAAWRSEHPGWDETA